MKSTINRFEELLRFRSLMGLSLSKEDVKYIWGKKYFKNLEEKEIKKLKENENPIIKKKVNYFNANVSKLKIFNWVQFIGISGSVAAGFVKEEDDIDVIVVVKNGTMWLYRGVIAFLNIFHNKIRAKRHKNIEDKICINLICEERGIKFEKDIFNFHELMFLIPIFNKEYLKKIYLENDWLLKEYSFKKENVITRISFKKGANFMIRFLNSLAFLMQLLFMKVTKHNPNVERIKRNNKFGRIEFFEYDYKKKILDNYSNEFKSTN